MTGWMAGMAGTRDPIVPDTKDWTWVLDRPCEECGFDAASRGVSELPRLLHDTAMTWSQVLARPDVAERPEPAVWSAREYGAHVHLLSCEEGPGPDYQQVHNPKPR